MNIPLIANVYAGPPAETRGKTPTLRQTLGVQIGTICCALGCPDDTVLAAFRRVYRHFLTEQTADVTIDLERSANGNGRHPPAEPGPKVIADEPERFVTEIQCDLDESGHGFRFLNRLFYMAYYTACLRKYGNETPALLVHACGILRRGRAFVFTGPSESGKTTLAGLCGEDNGRVISDEMVLISRPGPDGGASVQSVPIIGGFPPGINISVPLSCILLLKRGTTTRINPVNPVEAYLRLITQTIKPSYIGQREKATRGLLADFSQETTGSVPVYEMEFAIDKDSLWREMDNLEERLYGKVK